ncbi:LysM domain-containing protein [Bordetella sputigena]|uniref:FimV/HubP family polar landmark protein n=1 Tax=Bordetella sputigena TaxID=1416810 RepID=UPI0039EF4907
MNISPNQTQAALAPMQPVPSGEQSNRVARTTDATVATHIASTSPLRITVAAGDTVFGLAQRYRDTLGAGICQIAAAVWRQNPHAFHQNDMNRLKEGVHVQLPDADTIRAIPALEAAEICAAHIDPQQQRRHGTVGMAIRESFEDQRKLQAGDVELVYFRDTLGQIANRLDVADATLHQKLVAIANANPDALRNGNMNDLKTGVLLRMPSADQVLGTDHAQAKNIVLTQWQDFKQYTDPARKC